MTVRITVDTVNKTFPTGSLKIVQGEGGVDTVVFTLASDSGEVSLSDLYWIARVTYPSGYVSGTSLTKQNITADTFELLWEISTSITAEPGTVQIVLVGNDSLGNYTYKALGDLLDIRRDLSVLNLGAISADTTEQLVNQVEEVLARGGAHIQIFGQYDTLAVLEAAVTSPIAGMAYEVGTAAPYDIYVYDGVNSVWLNNGPLTAATAVLYTDMAMTVPQQAKTINNLGGSALGVWPLKWGGLGADASGDTGKAAARTNLGAVSGIWPLALGGLGIDASTPVGLVTARSNLGVPAITSGTWTPGLAGNTTDGAFVYAASRSGTWVRIGNIVFATMTCVISSITTAPTGSATKITGIAGLPAPDLSTTSAAQFVVLGGNNKAAGSNIQSQIAIALSGGTLYFFWRTPTNGNISPATLIAADGPNAAVFWYIAA